MLAASLNAFFCASPIYGSAEDFTFLLNFTPCEGVTPAAKQQIGETRKKCNSDDRRLRRIQGGAVGATASRMRAAAKQTLGAATRLSEAASIFPLRLPLRGLKGASSPFLVGPARRNRWCFSGSLLTSKENNSPNAKALCPAHRRDNHFWFSFDIKREQLALMKKRSILRRRRKNHSIVICSPSSSARTSAPVAGRLRTR